MLMLGGRSKSVDRLAFSPDGSLLAAAGDQYQPFDLWRVDSPDRPQRHIPVRFDKRYWNFCFHPADGLLLVADDSEVIAFDALTGEEAWRVEPQENFVLAGLSVSKDGRRLVVAELYQYLSESGYQWWELNGRKPPTRKQTAKGSPRCKCRGVVILPSAGIAVAEDRSTEIPAQIHLLTAEGRSSRIWRTSFDFVRQLAVTPNGRLIAAQFQRNVVIWDANDPDNPPAQIKNESRFAFTGIAFHPSGRYLAATSNDESVKLYDTATWEIARTFTWDIGRMRSVAFSPDGTLAAAGSDTGNVVVWDVDL